MTIDSVYQLAVDNNAIIQFDEDSMTPFFYYSQIIGIPISHVVWFIDVRTINALNKVVKDYSLYGSGIWNLMFYSPQLWTTINTQFEIIKLID
jgi:spore germination protein